MNAGRSQTVVVIGAGPAGLLAAVAAARQGARVRVLEQMDRPGLKLLASGGGRCNLTNTLPAAEYPARFGRQGRFLAPALAACGPGRTRELFAQLGVRTQSPDGFHVYPVTESSATVLAALLRELERLTVPVRVGVRVTDLECAAGRVRGVRADGELIPADAVVLAAGGGSHPELGGTGGGYALAQAAGQALVTPAPALVPLVTRETWPGELAGVALRGAGVTLEAAGRPQPTVRGDVLFTHRGLSGPAILDLSGTVAVRLVRQPAVPLRLNLLPPAAAVALPELMDRWRREHGRKSIVRLLADNGLPLALARRAAQQAGLAAGRTAAQLTAAERAALAGCLTACPLTVIATEGWAGAMVTRGGVDVRGVDPATLASRKVSGLYFAGEVLDVDGPCGGFNLQWAWASGWLAGTRAGGRRPET